MLTLAVAAPMRTVGPDAARSSTDEGDRNMEPVPANLDLEVFEIEHGKPPGCSGSSSTNPRCTCPVYFEAEEV